MTDFVLPDDLSGKNFYLVGIKGAGLSALAELLQAEGAQVRGSDTTEVYYTDAILRQLGIAFQEGFDAANLSDNIDYVIHSAAYNPESNPELQAARLRRLPIIKYPDALGAYSRRFDSSGIAGVHGKTTTTALAGSLCRALELPACVLAGSSVGAFGDRSTLCLGRQFFIAETCEYRRHFLSFVPRRIVLTSVESDHQDYFPNYEAIREAFVEYTANLTPGGELIYCADDRGATEVAALAVAKRPDISLTPYGETASGAFKIIELITEGAHSRFKIAAGIGDFNLQLPGRHSVLNAVAALALITSMLRVQTAAVEPKVIWTAQRLGAAQTALAAFQGSKRRSERLGEAGGVLVMDDYAHHPTAIRLTLEGLKAFYPARRLVVSFMPHTYSRTMALLDDFASAFKAADFVYFHEIFPSARESFNPSVSGRMLFDKAVAQGLQAAYFDQPLAATDSVIANCQPGDLFLTMGAGNNWRLAQAVLAELIRRHPESL